MAHFATIVALVGIVVLVASLLSGLLERSRVPVVAVFLGLGLLLGPWGLGLADIGFDSPELRALATLALALVLFSDAVSFDVRQIRTLQRLVLRILGPGTLLPALLVAIAARFLLHLPWPAAAILGAALASTDPVLLRTLLRSPSLPETPRTALRMESGMNDIVLLPIVVLAMLFLRASAPGAGEAMSKEIVLRNVAGLFLLGPGIGALIGWGGISALAWVRDRFGVRRDYESLYALGLAFTAYAAAEAVGGSGFVAAFAAGLLVAIQDVELCDCFLEYGEATAEILLLLTFVALGTTLIWSGLDVIDGPTLLFAGIALAARTAVLYPVLGNLGLSGHDRRVIALIGPRGLSSLLLVLLPVFAGLPGAERLFAIACLVVLLSVVVHGGAIALLLRSKGTPSASEVSPRPLKRSDEAPLRVTLEEVRALRAAGEPVVIVDARKDRAFREDPRTASGAVRVNPDDPIRDAKAMLLSRHATLVVYCA